MVRLPRTTRRGTVQPCESRAHNSAAVSFSHSVPTGLPGLFLGDESGFRDPRVLARRGVLLGASEAVCPRPTTLIDRTFHEATNSRSPAVTTYTRPPSRRTGSSPDATRRYAAARLIPSSVAARGTASSNGRSLNTLLSNLIHLHSAVSLSLRTASRTKLGRFGAVGQAYCDGA
jgi:hypothetical protein